MNANRTFRLEAEISSDEPERIRPALEAVVGAQAVTPAPGGFRVVCALDGPSAKDLNRDLLSTLRRVVKKTRLRARWTADGTTERFFDYVPKGSGPTQG